MTENLTFPSEAKYLNLINYFALSDNDKKLILPILDSRVIATIKILEFLEGKGPVSWFEIAKHFGSDPGKIEYHIRYISRFFDFTIDRTGSTLNQKFTA